MDPYRILGGHAEGGSESAWRDAIVDTLLPAFRAIPGVHDAKACWPERREDDPPAIACQFVLEFADRADLERMLASSERAALRPQVQAAIALFDGRISHIEYRVD